MSQYNEDLSKELNLLLESEDDRKLFVEQYFKGRSNMAISIHRFRLHKLKDTMSYEKFEECLAEDPQAALARLTYRIITEDTVDYIIHRLKKNSLTGRELYDEIVANSPTSIEMIFPILKKYMG